jgi:hypothetical protein
MEGLSYDRWKNDKSTGCKADVMLGKTEKGSSSGSSSLFSRVFRGGAEKRLNEALRLFDKNRNERVKLQGEEYRIQIWSTTS